MVAICKWCLTEQRDGGAANNTKTVMIEYLRASYDVPRSPRSPRGEAGMMTTDDAMAAADAMITDITMIADASMRDIL
jgi:hypothetical protein